MIALLALLTRFCAYEKVYCAPMDVEDSETYDIGIIHDDLFFRHSHDVKAMDSWIRSKRNDCLTTKYIMDEIQEEYYGYFLGTKFLWLSYNGPKLNLKKEDNLCECIEELIERYRKKYCIKLSQMDKDRKNLLERDISIFKEIAISSYEKVHNFLEEIFKTCLPAEKTPFFYTTTVGYIDEKVSMAIHWMRRGELTWNNYTYRIYYNKNITFHTDMDGSYSEATIDLSIRDLKPLCIKKLAKTAPDLQEYYNKSDSMSLKQIYEAETSEKLLAWARIQGKNNIKAEDKDFYDSVFAAIQRERELNTKALFLTSYNSIFIDGLTLEDEDYSVEEERRKLQFLEKKHPNVLNTEITSLFFYSLETIFGCESALCAHEKDIHSIIVSTYRVFTSYYMIFYRSVYQSIVDNIDHTDLKEQLVEQFKNLDKIYRYLKVINTEKTKSLGLCDQDQSERQIKQSYESLYNLIADQDMYTKKISIVLQRDMQESVQSGNKRLLGSYNYGKLLEATKKLKNIIDF